MKKLIFYSSIFVFMLSFFCAKAQNVSLGLQGGISIPNLSAGGSGSTPLSTGYSSRSGPDFGIYAEFKVSNLFSIQPALEYSAQGGKKNGLQALPDPNPQGPPYLYANYNSTAKLNYLMLPVLAKFGWDFHNSPLRFFADAGPFLAYRLSATQVTSGTSLVYADKAETEPTSPTPQNFDHTTDINHDIHHGNFGVEGNVGLIYKLNKSYLFIQAGGNYGFRNIQIFAADGSNETGAATVTVGYSFWLGKH